MAEKFGKKTQGILAKAPHGIHCVLYEINSPEPPMTKITKAKKTAESSKQASVSAKKILSSACTHELPTTAELSAVASALGAAALDDIFEKAEDGNELNYWLTSIEESLSKIAAETKSTASVISALGLLLKVHDSTPITESNPCCHEVWNCSSKMSVLASSLGESGAPEFISLVKEISSLPDPSDYLDYLSGANCILSIAKETKTAGAAETETDDPISGPGVVKEVLGKIKKTNKKDMNAKFCKLIEVVEQTGCIDDVPAVLNCMLSPTGSEGQWLVILSLNEIAKSSFMASCIVAASKADAKSTSGFIDYVIDASPAQKGLKSKDTKPVKDAAEAIKKLPPSIAALSCTVGSNLNNVYSQWTEPEGKYLMIDGFSWLNENVGKEAIMKVAAHLSSFTKIQPTLAIKTLGKLAGIAHYVNGSKAEKTKALYQALGFLECFESKAQAEWALCSIAWFAEHNSSPQSVEKMFCALSELDDGKQMSKLASCLSNIASYSKDLAANMPKKDLQKALGIAKSVAKAAAKDANSG